MSEQSPPVGPLVADFSRYREDGFELAASLEVKADETLAVVGPNGAGKSTFVEVVAGLQPVDRGRIGLGGATLDDPTAGHFIPPHERHIGVVFQDYLLFDHLTVAENISFGPKAAGADRAAIRSRVGDLMDLVRVSDLANRSPSSLSGGQRQRVALARAIATEPRALLLDEPMAALDVNTKSRIRRVLADVLAATNGPRVLVTHDPIDAFLLADRICVLEGGRVTQMGTAADIRRQPASDYIAALMGTNLLTGSNDGGMVAIDRSSVVLHTVHPQPAGPVVVTIDPNMVALHQARPDGSPRNTWSTTIATVEDRGDITRVVLNDPLALEVDITPSAAAALKLRPGSEVWAAVKATEIQVTAGKASAET